MRTFWRVQAGIAVATVTSFAVLGGPACTATGPTTDTSTDNETDAPYLRR